MQIAFKFEEDQLLKEASQWKLPEADKGQIYTLPKVVDFMTTLIGLNDAKDIENIRILEPSCGKGEFVVAIAECMIKNSKRKPTINQLMGKMLAIDLVDTSVEVAKSRVSELLVNYDYQKKDIKKLLKDWFLTTDFLLKDIEPNFTHVIGNPPYVRVENVPKRLLGEYRRKFSTMTNRADLYIPFFEKSLSLLINGGKLSFICTDRWIKNTYGKSLRKLISENYSLELYIDLYGIDAFEQDVMTYPAITQIIKTKGIQTALMHETSFTSEEAEELLKAINGKPTNVLVRKNIIASSKPWLLGSSDQIALIHKLEHNFPTLEEAKCKVFIGAATGANKIYIVEKESVEIENSRLLPVITAKELKAEKIQWNGKYLVNTYDENGVISLENYPKLSKYLHNHKDKLCKRHVAKKDSAFWYKTIDRVYYERSKMEKLLIPDISSDPVVIYDEGIYHPNNSIYYICSNDWNLHALRVVLLSNVTKIFISTYSTKMAKGYLRFQAQHLRKLRIPNWSSIDDKLRVDLIKAGQSNDTDNFNKLTFRMYHLNNKEKSIIGI